MEKAGTALLQSGSDHCYPHLIKKGWGIVVVRKIG